MSKLTHRIEKKAVEILVDRIMAERNPADRQKTLKRLSYVMQHLFGDLFEKESFDDARRLIDEGGKWFRFLNTALDTLNPHVVKTAVMDLGFEAGFTACVRATPPRRNITAIFPGPSSSTRPAPATCIASAAGLLNTVIR